jgi:hypothetical protein
MLIRSSFLAVAFLALAGCGQAPTPKTTDDANASSSVVIPTSFFTTTRATDVPNLIDAKKVAKVGETTTFLARVGGRVPSFIDGYAIMVVADPGLVSCELMGEKDHCPTPEDYCCEDPSAIRTGLATIMFNDATGTPLPISASGQGGLELLKYVVVEGTVTDMNDEGVFIVDATSVWVGGKPDRSDLHKGSGG